MRRLAAILAFSALALSAASVSAASRAYATTGAQGDTTVEMEAGQTSKVTLYFKNSGSYTWRGTGKNYVSLYATGPYKRKSVFRDGSWAGTYQAARLSQATVSPGKTGTVTFTLRAPRTAGIYHEQFQLAVENTAFIYGSVARLTINVLPETITMSTPVSAKSYYAMDLSTGASMREQEASEVRNIASITKLMTVMVAHEAGLDPDAVVALERRDEVGGGRLRVAVGTKLTVRNLVASVIVGSANNAANALARATGLTKEEFVARMNEKARSLGLAATAFMDPTGIEVGNVSTAKEVALMARAAFNDSWIAEFAAEPEYEVATAKGPHLIKNTNKLLGYDGLEVLAGKTGFIYEAGYTLVTELKKDGKNGVIVVVLGSDTQADSFRDAKVVAEQAWLAQSDLAAL